MKLDESHYYNGAKALSYNCPITMVCSERTFGKTYYYKRRAIQNFIEKGYTWLYLRRYDSQVKEQLRKKQSFFGDIVLNDEFPGYEFRVNGRVFECKRPGEKTFETMGAFVALNAFESQKGVVDARLHTIVFDEFIKSSRRTRYMPDELSAFASLWESYDRKEDRVRWVMLANLTDMLNPYFLEWGITPYRGMPEYTRWKNKTVLLHMARSDAAFQERSKASNIVQVFGGSKYDNVNRLSILDTADQSFIAPKTPEAKYQVTLAFQGDCLAVWLDMGRGEYYVARKRPKTEKVLALTREDMRPNMVMIGRASPWLDTLARMYRYGFCLFDNANTRERTLNMLQAFGKLN